MLISQKANRLLANFIESSSRQICKNLLSFNCRPPLYNFRLQSNKMQITRQNDLGMISQSDQCLFISKKSGNEKLDQKSLPKARKRTYQWSDEQNKKYYTFLRTLKQLNAIQLQKVKIRYINIKMSAYIKTRTSNQCRSHHQKMLSRFGNYENIISHFHAYFLRKDDNQEGNKEDDDSFSVTPSLQKYVGQIQGVYNNIMNWPITDWDLRYVLQGSKGIEIVYQ